MSFYPGYPYGAPLATSVARPVSYAAPVQYAQAPVSYAAPVQYA